MASPLEAQKLHPDQTNFQPKEGAEPPLSSPEFEEFIAKQELISGELRQEAKDLMERRKQPTWEKPTPKSEQTPSKQPMELAAEVKGLIALIRSFANSRR